MPRTAPKNKPKPRQPEPPPSERSEYMSVDQVAEWLGTSAMSIRIRIREGSLVAYRLPGTSTAIRLKRSEVEAALVPVESALTPAGSRPRAAESHGSVAARRSGGGRS